MMPVLLVLFQEVSWSLIKKGLMSDRTSRRLDAVDRQNNLMTFATKILQRDHTEAQFNSVRADIKHSNTHYEV